MQPGGGGLLLALAALLLVVLLSVWVGTRQLAFTAVWSVLWHDDGSSDAAIIHELRIPRTLLAVLVGAALGLAGRRWEHVRPLALAVAILLPLVLHYGRQLALLPLIASDLVVQRVFGATTLPVGLATSAVGGVYLAWLLTHEWRRTRA